MAAIDELESRYEFHCRAAREVAEEFFDARRVLTYLIERAVQPVSTAVSNASSGP
jgi:hypothetical protein